MAETCEECQDIFVDKDALQRHKDIAHDVNGIENKSINPDPDYYTPPPK